MVDSAESSRAARTLLIRADASVAIGTGHVMRCLALAQQWQDDGGRAVFAMAKTTPAIRARLLSEFCAVVAINSGTPEADAQQTVRVAREQNANWVMVDGYRFSAAYQHALKSAGVKVLFLDDNGHARHYSADVLLNQNVSANEQLYADRESYTQLLLGPQYSLLRREFRAARNSSRNIAVIAKNVLVTVGGSDPDNVTLRVIDALKPISTDLEVVVVIGGSNPHSTSIQKAAANSRHKIRVVTDPPNMAEFMTWADLAVSGAGTTCLEMCLLGLSAIAITVAENQRASALELDRRGCVVHLDGENGVQVNQLTELVRLLLSDQTKRRSLSRRARELVDGNGTRRVYDVLRSWSE